MLQDPIQHPPSIPARLLHLGSILIALLPLVWPAVAGDKVHRIRGLFCNSADQLDEALANMSLRLSPQAAVELTNRDAIVCTYVDLLHYVVDSPALVADDGGVAPFFKYEGTLVGVQVGSEVRPVTPPMPIFFAVPERLAGVPLQRSA